VAEYERILGLLADGRFHSGESIARTLGCSRSAVWKRIETLRARTGLQIDAVTGRGYRLRRPLELLDGSRITARLDNASIELLNDCQVLGSVTSTNSLAGEQGVPAGNPAIAWFAEHQTAGRGRRGRAWQSPYGRNLYFSLAYRFDLPMARLSGLSLATGAVIADVLAAQGLERHGLKWPNDLLWESRKLGGILLEAQGETDGPATAVIGVGLNLDLDRDASDQIGQPVACLREAGVEVSRNHLAGDLLDALLRMCQRYAEEGLGPYLTTWRRFDMHCGQRVRLIGSSEEWCGESLGIADDGGLRLRIGDQVQTFYGGELSLRTGHQV
jgi:BirA family transcriptional regulator, biotin operon repressor / biotin---[acetyl-CoA-carboxylase] ligase